MITIHTTQTYTFPTAWMLPDLNGSGLPRFKRLVLKAGDNAMSVDDFTSLTAETKEWLAKLSSQGVVTLTLH